MPTYNTDGAYSLRALEGSNPISDIDAGFAALRDDVNDTFAGYSEGPLASRPTSTVGTPGIAGRIYGVTDVPGRFDIDHGTGWDIVLSAAKVLGVPRTLSEVIGSFPGNPAGGTGMFYFTGGPIRADEAADPSPIEFLEFDPADFAASGLTLQMRVSAAAISNGTSPAIGFTFGLWPLTSGGGAGDHIPNLGVQISGSDITLNPTTNDLKRGSSSWFTAPAAGFYALAVSLTGVVATNSAGALRARLEIRHA